MGVRPTYASHAGAYLVDSFYSQRILGQTIKYARTRVLVVDDHHDGAEALGLLLDLLGCDVRLAYSGRQALTIAPAFDPDLVVLDLQMPDMDGIETARRLRAQSWSWHCVFASHSASANPEIGDISHRAGFQHHVRKPSPPGTFEALLATLSSEHEA